MKQAGRLAGDHEGTRCQGPPDQQNRSGAESVDEVAREKGQRTEREHGDREDGRNAGPGGSEFLCKGLQKESKRATSTIIDRYGEKGNR